MALPTQAQALDTFIDQVRRNPWSTLAKSELEFMIFELLVDTGRIDPETQSDMLIASYLETTPTRVQNLRFKYEQKRFKEIGVGLYLQKIIVYETQDGKAIIGIDSKYLRERLIDEMRTRSHLAERLRDPSQLKVDPRELSVTLDELDDKDKIQPDTHKKLKDIEKELRRHRKLKGGRSASSSAFFLSSLLAI